MKIRFILAYIAALCLLTGCAQEVGKVSYSSDDDTVAVMAEQEETEAPTDEPETEPVRKSEPHADVQLLVDETIEVYDEITLSDLFIYTNAELENPDEIVDTSRTGELSVTVAYTYNDELYEHEVSYIVKDTTDPILLNSGSNAYVERGKVFDLNDHVGFADNYDSKPTLTYTGTVDTSVCGTYPLYATATDSAGNSTIWLVKIKVVDEIPEPEDNNPRLSFESFTNEYAGDNVSFGIDVSKWQGDIDFEAVKNAGCSFVIMRMGTYYDEYALDQYYLENMEKARAAGLDVGVYIYTTANTEEEARDNARWISEQLNGQELDFPVVFDWESFGSFQKYEMSIHDLNSYFEAFAEEIKSEGYSAMLYSSKNFLNNFWYEHSDYPIWLAHYTDETDYTGEYAMWQMSCYGRIDGIYADADLNILYTDKKLN